MNKSQQQFGEPDKFIRAKLKSVLEPVVQEFISSSPFIIMATSNGRGECDASPRGGSPGFVKVLDEKSLLIPDFPGNKLFQSYENIEANPKAGLIFMIPGCGLTVRVNGRVRIIGRDELQHRKDWAQLFDPDKDKFVQQALLLTIDEVYPHCPKAFTFSKLWDPQIIAQNMTTIPDQYWFKKWPA